MARAPGGDSGDARRGSAPAPPRSARAVRRAAVAGCSSPSHARSRRLGAPAALRVSTVHGADTLDERARADLESDVGDVLSQYVVAGVPRGLPARGLRARASTRSPAGPPRARLPTSTCSPPPGSRMLAGVSATRLEAELSFLVEGSDVVGASAHVDFGFEVTDADGDTRPLSLTGRLMLSRTRAPGRSSGTTWRATTPARSSRRWSRDGARHGPVGARLSRGVRLLLLLASTLLVVPDLRTPPDLVSLSAVRHAKAGGLRRRHRLDPRARLGRASGHGRGQGQHRRHPAGRRSTSQSGRAAADRRSRGTRGSSFPARHRTGSTPRLKTGGRGARDPTRSRTWSASSPTTSSWRVSTGFVDMMDDGR